jgi:predicted Fe-Mo cluster-binding NifX family protein
MFLLVDTESNHATTITKADSYQSHGVCKSLKARSCDQVDGFVVGNTGAGARNQLQRSGLRAFKAQGSTVLENIGKITLDTLLEFGEHDNCAGHGNGGC